MVDTEPSGEYTQGKKQLTIGVMSALMREMGPSGLRRDIRSHLGKSGKAL